MLKRILFWVLFIPFTIILILIWLINWKLKNKVLFELERLIYCFEYWGHDIPLGYYLNDPRFKERYFAIYYKD